MDVNLITITHQIPAAAAAGQVREKKPQTVQDQKQPKIIVVSGNQKMQKAEKERGDGNKLPTSGNHLEFTLDKATEKMVVQVVDGESGEVIGQIPSEIALRLKAYLKILNT